MLELRPSSIISLRGSACPRDAISDQKTLKWCVQLMTGLNLRLCINSRAYAGYLFGHLGAIALHTETEQSL